MLIQNLIKAGISPTLRVKKRKPRRLTLSQVTCQIPFCHSHVSVPILFPVTCQISYLSLRPECKSQMSQVINSNFHHCKICTADHFIQSKSMFHNTKLYKVYCTRLERFHVLTSIVWEILETSCFEYKPMPMLMSVRLPNQYISADFLCISLTLFDQHPKKCFIEAPALASGVFTIANLSWTCLKYKTFLLKSKSLVTSQGYSCVSVE